MQTLLCTEHLYLRNYTFDQHYIKSGTYAYYIININTAIKINKDINCFHLLKATVFYS